MIEKEQAPETELEQKQREELEGKTEEIPLKMKARVQEAQTLKRLVSLVSKVLKNADLYIYKDRIEISGLDKSRVAQAHLSIPASFFTTFEVSNLPEPEPEEDEQSIIEKYKEELDLEEEEFSEEPIYSGSLSADIPEEVIEEAKEEAREAKQEKVKKLGVNITRLSKRLDRVRNSESLELEIDQTEAEKIVIKAIPGADTDGFKRRFRLPLTDPSQDEVEPSKLEYNAKVEFAPPSHFSRIVKDASLTGEDLTLTAKTGKELVFRASSGIGSDYKAKVDLEEDVPVLNFHLDIPTDREKIEAIFGLDYLEDMTTKYSELVRLEWANDNPLRILHNFPGGASLHFLVAPRIV